MNKVLLCYYKELQRLSITIRFQIFKNNFFFYLSLRQKIEAATKNSSSLTCVHALVSEQRFFQASTMATNIAHKRFQIGVDFHVLLQISFVDQSFVTNTKESKIKFSAQRKRSVLCLI